MPPEHFAAQAGKHAGLFVKRILPGMKLKQGKQLAGHAGRHAGSFVKHVLPAAAKPVHSLWHEILGFFFLAFAGIAAWKAIRNSASLGPVRLAILSVFILIMALYGVSSFLKARRISRS